MDDHKMQWRNNLRIDEFFQVSKKEAGAEIVVFWPPLTM